MQKHEKNLKILQSADVSTKKSDKNLEIKFLSYHLHDYHYQ